LNAFELRQLRRALLLDRLTRGLRVAAVRDERGADFGREEHRPSSGANVPLLPLLLDGLSRCAADSDAALVGAQLEHRLEWSEGPPTEPARLWAALGDSPAQPAIATVLARRPAAAPRIAALLRAGLLRLLCPGRGLRSAAPRALNVPPRPTLVP